MIEHRDYEFITHCDKQIIYVDYRNKEETFLLEMMKRLVVQIPKMCEGKDKKYLLLVNMTDVYTTPEITEQIKQLAKVTKPFVKKGAVIMQSRPTTRIIFQFVNRIAGDNRKMFTTEKDAKEWLVAP